MTTVTDRADPAHLQSQTEWREKEDEFRKLKKTQDEIIEYFSGHSVSVIDGRYAVAEQGQ
jgi:hypothetical protein